MNKPWKLIQEDKWPFNIVIVDTSGEIILKQGRYAYSSRDKTIEDVMGCRHHSYGKERDDASAANHKQLARLQHIVDCVNAQS